MSDSQEKPKYAGRIFLNLLFGLLFGGLYMLSGLSGAYSNAPIGDNLGDYILPLIAIAFLLRAVYLIYKLLKG